jgi:hypothetical protein
MRKAIFCGVLISIILMSCSKSTSPWTGTYTGSGASNTVNRVIINPNGSNLQLQLQVLYSGAYYTYATIQNAAVSGNTLTVNENGLLYGSTDTYRFVGTGALSGNNLILTGSATNTTNSSDVRYYYFSGNK